MVLDMVGGDYVARNLDALAVEGRLVQIAFLKSSRVEIDLMQVMRRRLTITARRCGRARRKKRAPSRGSWSSTSGRSSRAAPSSPSIHATFPLDRAAEAHRVMEESHHIGKLILTTA